MTDRHWSTHRAWSELRDAVAAVGLDPERFPSACSIGGGSDDLYYLGGSGPAWPIDAPDNEYRQKIVTIQINGAVIVMTCTYDDGGWDTSIALPFGASVDVKEVE